MVTGTTIEEPGMFGGKKSRKMQAEILAILAFLAAIAGLVLSFLKIRQNTMGMAIIGGIGAVMLLLLKLKLDKDILRGGQGMLQVEYVFGFWVVLLLNLSAAGLNAFIFYKDKKDSEAHINQLSSN